MAGARATQVVAEVLRDGPAAGRATQVVAEVLRDGNPAARATQVVVEVLRSSIDFAIVHTAPPVTFGPPVPGAPWTHFRLPEPPKTASPPQSMLPDVMAPPDTPAQPVRFGPPVPGAPWTAFFRVESPPKPLGNNRPPTPAAPVGPGRGKQRNYINRVPRLLVPSAESAQERLGREEGQKQRQATQADKLHAMLNALMATGEVVQRTTQDWRLRSGGHVHDRNPTAADDLTTGCTVGCTWVNSATQAVFICTRNAIGNASWKELS